MEEGEEDEEEVDDEVTAEEASEVESRNGKEQTVSPVRSDPSRSLSITRLVSTPMLPASSFSNNFPFVSSSSTTWTRCFFNLKFVSEAWMATLTAQVPAGRYLSRMVQLLLNRLVPLLSALRTRRDLLLRQHHLRRDLHLFHQRKPLDLH